MPFTRRPIADRLWEKTAKGDGCWVFTGIISPLGYGLINEGGRKGRMKRAHRVAWEATHGPIPDGLFVCHHCDNRACIRPDHLFLGTNSDNMKDASRKGRLPDNSRPGRSRNRGERNGHAVLDEEKVRYIRANYMGRSTAAQLAERFGVSPETVRAVGRRRIWKHID